jgi:hypothetical protein
MIRSTVAGQFLAALGLERLMELAVQAHLVHFRRKILVEYSREARFGRARLLRCNPLDYRKVRDMDRALEEAAARLREMELEQSL